MKKLILTEYHPPSDETVERFVRSASIGMASKSGDQGYLDPEVTWGLSEFIKLVGELKAKQLNNAATNGVFDTRINEGYPIEK
jgi:hypothetical protein